MSTQIIDNFQLNTTKPMDNRFVVGTGQFYTNKNDIVYKYNGLRIWDLDNSLPFRWNGSTWVSDGYTGTGTAKYLSKFTSSNVIGDSSILENSTYLNIGKPIKTNGSAIKTQSIKTTGTTTISNDIDLALVYVNSSSSPITINLPISPVDGQRISIRTIITWTDTSYSLKIQTFGVGQSFEHLDGGTADPVYGINSLKSHLDRTWIYRAGNKIWYEVSNNLLESTNGILTLSRLQNGTSGYTLIGGSSTPEYTSKLVVGTSSTESTQIFKTNGRSLSTGYITTNTRLDNLIDLVIGYTSGVDIKTTMPPNPINGQKITFRSINNSVGDWYLSSNTSQTWQHSDGSVTEYPIISTYKTLTYVYYVTTWYQISGPTPSFWMPPL